MGSKKKKTTQTYKPPSWVEGGARQAMSLGQRIGGQAYTPYSGDRVAGLSENEAMGINLARESSGAYQPYFDEGAALTRRATQQFADADMSSYMNPYIEAAIDPAARRMREEGQRALNDVNSRAAQMDAFGGSRAALLRSETQRGTMEGISDLYARGMSDAYDRAVSIWGQERARDMMAGGQIMQLGQAVQNARSTDINTLMNTGAVDRSIRQAMQDFDYQQFIENRDWDIRNLSGLLSALQGTKGSYTTTQTSTTKESGGELGQILGVAATVGGAFLGGPGGAALGASLFGKGTQDFTGGSSGALSFNIPSVDQVPLGDTAGLLLGGGN